MGIEGVEMDRDRNYDVCRSWIEMGIKGVQEMDRDRN